MQSFPPPRQAPPPDRLALARTGLTALQAGDALRAEACLAQVTATGRADPSVWTALAMARLKLGKLAEARAAADEALALDPRNVRALITAGDCNAARGDGRAASTFYAAALQVAPAAPSGDLAGELARARRAHAELSAAFEAHLLETLAAHGYHPERSSRRATHALELLTGKRQVHLQQPKVFYFPELPQRQFYEREEFGWAAEVEAATDAIRAELAAVMEQATAFAPYMARRADRPVLQRHHLADNTDWSAFFLWRNGAVVEENAARCPRTMQALERAPLARTPGRSPSVMFSKLAPGARIPPHHGYVNTRLICHLPLVVPEGCGFRVGNETRPWREGELLIFDDTVEHEAWNNSDRTRVVLLFDIWRPELTEEERTLVNATLEAAGAYGETAEWSA